LKKNYCYEPISEHQRLSAVEWPLSAFASSLFKIREIRGFQPKSNQIQTKKIVANSMARGSIAARWMHGLT